MRIIYKLSDKARQRLKLELYYQIIDFDFDILSDGLKSKVLSIKSQTVQRRTWSVCTYHADFSIETSYAHFASLGIFINGNYGNHEPFIVESELEFDRILTLEEALEYLRISSIQRKISEILVDDIMIKFKKTEQPTEITNARIESDEVLKQRLEKLLGI